jgi:hypothetical protein
MILWGFTSMTPSVMRVVARYVLAAGIPLGETVEFGSVRIHRYADHFQVTDLTFAGKRGKKVRLMNISPTYAYKGDKSGWMDRVGDAMSDYRSYDQVKGFIKDMLADFPGEISINEYETRGVDVNPGGSERISIKTPNGIEINALPDNFGLVFSYDIPDPEDPDRPANDSAGKSYRGQDTLYYPKSKKDAAVFYNWLKANRAEVQKMTIQDFRKLWDTLGVRFDYH